MKAVLSWLRDFTAIEEDIKTLCAALTDSGSKVEGYEREAEGITGVLTGRVLSIERHNNADSLFVCQLDLGQGQVLPIVTGATNVKAGQIVPVAVDGAVLAGGLKIKKGKLRGEASHGMLCSVSELGYTADVFPGAIEDGILILPETLPLGLSIQKALELDETTIEFEITSNRPDCLSMEGLGRELAVTFRREFLPVEPAVVARSETRTEDLIQLRNEAPELCLMYRARAVEGITLGPSPQWLQKRLRAAGIRPIDNIVDITNYVMLELGQPLHAFDLDRIGGGEIVVRRARAAESIVTLDGQERRLDGDMLAICDREHPMAVAGVMGGEASGINAQTQTIVFEAALFAASNIRKTSQRLGLRSESSLRFEKGLDPKGVARALERACQLVEQLGCGRVCQGEVVAEGQLPSAVALDWDAGRIAGFLGADISAEFMADIFTRIGCRTLEQRTEDGALCGGCLEMPSFRADLEGEADLAEEVARFYGYNNIEPSLLSGKAFTRGGLNREQSLREKLMELCLGQGYYQCFTYSFENPKLDDWLELPADSPLRRRILIRNASEEYKAMRSSLLPSLLKVAAHNASRGVARARFFEIAKVFSQKPEQNPADLPDERQVLAAVSYDLAEDKRSGAGFFALKALAEEMAALLGLRLDWRRETPLAALNPYRSAAIYLGERPVGLAAYLLPKLHKRLGSPESCAYLELELAPLLEAANLRRSQKPLPKYPAIKRDLAFILGRGVPASAVEQLLLRQGRPYIQGAELFDVYEGKQVDEGKKSMAYRLSFRSPDKTLTDEEVNAAMKRIVESLGKEWAADIRS